LGIYRRGRHSRFPEHQYAAVKKEHYTDYADRYGYPTRKRYPSINAGKTGDGDRHARENKEHQAVIERAHRLLQNTRAARDFIQQIDYHFEAFFIHRDRILIRIDKHAKAFLERPHAIDHPPKS